MPAGDPIRLGSAAGTQLIFESNSTVTTSDSGIQSCSVKALYGDGQNVFSVIPAAGVSFNSVFGNSYLPSSFLVDYTEGGPTIDYLDGRVARVTITFKRQDPAQTNSRKIFVDSTINYQSALGPMSWILASGTEASENIFGFPEPVVTVKYNSNTRPGIGSGGLAQLYAQPGSPNASGFPDAPDITVPISIPVAAGAVVTYFNGTTFVTVTLSVPTLFNFILVFKANPRGWQLIKLKSDPVASSNFYDVEENWRNFYVFTGVTFVSAIPPP